MKSSTLKIQTPRVFKPLLSDVRYKGAHGGRGSGKSHFFAELLIERCMLAKTRWVCIREVQNSIKQSVKLLLDDKIEKFGLWNYFRSTNEAIHTPCGGHISFQGMSDQTADSIKSLEGYDGAWWEEAQTASKRSFMLLRPTIRKPGSQLWFSWNPESEDDSVDAFFRGENRITEDVVCVEANYVNNPWFSGELEKEMKIDRERDPEGFEHVWMGGYVTISEAVIFSKRVKVEQFETPKDARFYFGADFGYSQDPGTLMRCFIKDDCLYIDYEAFGYGVELDELPGMYDSIPESRKWPIKGDNSRPETISHIKRRGFNIAAAEKWQGSVEDGITFLKGFKQIIIHERCPQMQREARLYSWKVDKRTGDILPIIVDKHNHGWDALRYALDGLIKKAPVSIFDL